MKKGIKLVSLEGKEIKGCSINFLSIVNNDGEYLIKHTKSPIIIGEEKFTVFCLSISNKKWIATDGIRTYITELSDKKTGVKLPDFKNAFKNKKPAN